MGQRITKRSGLLIGSRQLRVGLAGSCCGLPWRRMKKNGPNRGACLLNRSLRIGGVSAHRGPT